MHKKLRPMGERERRKRAVHASSVLTVRSGTGQSTACPGKGRAKTVI